jgi:hypothetical protein
VEQTTDILFLLADLRKCSYFRREIERARAFFFLGKKIRAASPYLSREIRKEKKETTSNSSRTAQRTGALLGFAERVP